MAENQTRDSIRDVYGPRAPYIGEGQWPVRIDQRTTEEPERWVQSCCVLCSNGCALDIGVRGNRIVGVRGRGVDPVNRGRLGPKGLHGWAANNSQDRLTRPLIRKGGKLVETTWDEAMDLFVRTSKVIIEKYTGKACGIYGTGQLFIEEYHTIAMIAKAGLRTPHKDGNTRLCTATAEWALQETFGSDGQPSSYADVDVADTILFAGHDVAATQTVLFARILDRLAGPNPPKLIVIDPRTTEVARHAAVHLRPRVGSNVAVMNGLINLVIRSGHIDEAFIENHTVGFEELASMVSKYSPEEVERISQVPVADLTRAAQILATTPRLLCTVLQGFYQSHQATAASVQVNNLALIRGMIGKPGCGVMQMNGQPTAQNTRECGANGSYAIFYNFENPRHMAELARGYNVDPSILPTYQPPTNVMQMIRYCETGSIKLFWIIATNPAVSLPDLNRIRRVLSKEDLFVVVQDAWLTETAQLADIVLPAAIWGEKTGTFTNADRTVHISHKAIDPPGEAKSDFHIFVDYARRMGFTDKDGQPLIKWTEPESSFNHFKAMTRGRLCDYSGMSYARLTGGPGLRWPCNEQHPDGAPRLYTDFHFPTGYDECETWGHDLDSGAEVPPINYRANDPAGRAILRAAEYTPPVEEPDDQYPLWLTTGRIVYHFHTRTKTGRSKELRDVAPDAFVQMNAADAQKFGIANGDMVEVESRRGKVLVPAKVGGISPEGLATDILSGHVFIPFHFGYWDEPGRQRAANELTLPYYDPISKQPYFKCAAVRVKKIAGDAKAAAAVPPATELAKSAVGVAEAALGTVRSGKKVHVYLGLLKASEQQLAGAFTAVGDHHPLDTEVSQAAKKFAAWSAAHVAGLEPFIDRFRADEDPEPKRLRSAMFRGPRPGGLGLMRDVQDLWLLAQECEIGWLALKQVAKALGEKDMEEIAEKFGEESHGVVDWCHTAFKAHIAQALLMG